MSTILLVTGSHTVDTVDCMWVETMLHPRLAGTQLLIAGDACGPDTIAHEMALNRRIKSARWCTDGRVEYCRPTSWWDEARWDTVETPVDPAERALARNAAMVAWCAGRMAAGDDVRALGLVVAASATHGVDHTLQLCRDAGVRITRLVWTP